LFIIYFTYVTFGLLNFLRHFTVLLYSNTLTFCFLITVDCFIFFEIIFKTYTETNGPLLVRISLSSLSLLILLFSRWVR